MENNIQNKFVNEKIVVKKNEKDLSDGTKVVILALGGAGGNMVESMIDTFSEQNNALQFVICNTDAQVMKEARCKNRIQLGPDTTKGQGAGSNPEVGRKAALESINDVLSFVKDADMVIIVAGIGGGTGTGGLEPIAKAIKDAGILTIAFVTTPFSFEKKRLLLARESLAQAERHIDTLAVISNQNLYEITDPNTPFCDAFKIINDFLSRCIGSIIKLFKSPGLINVDFADICTVIRNKRGRALIGIGFADGDSRGIRAADNALASFLLDSSSCSWKEVNSILVIINGGADLSLADIDAATDRISSEISPTANMIIGTNLDESMKGSVEIFVFGTTDQDEEILKSKLATDEVVYDSDTSNEPRLSLHEPAKNEYKTDSSFFSSWWKKKPTSDQVEDSPIFLKKRSS